MPEPENGSLVFSSCSVFWLDHSQCPPTRWLLWSQTCVLVVHLKNPSSFCWWSASRRSFVQYCRVNTTPSHEFSPLAETVYQGMASWSHQIGDLGDGWGPVMPIHPNAQHAIHQGYYPELPMPKIINVLASDNNNKSSHLLVGQPRLLGHCELHDLVNRCILFWIELSS